MDKNFTKLQMNLPPLGKVFWFCGTEDGDPQDCVDWAERALSQGAESPSLAILAGLCAPLNCFEVKEYTEKTLKELGIKPPTGKDAVLAYVRDLAGEIIEKRETFRENLGTISNLCSDNDYLEEIMDFYLLWWAYSDLKYQDYQHYWPGATKYNIDGIIMKKCQEYIEFHDKSLPI